jgi:hypothetical protein
VPVFIRKQTFDSGADDLAIFAVGDNRLGCGTSRVIIHLMTDDLSRQVATTPDSEFSLSIDDALERYARAGLPRTPRSIQRYCAKGHLDCRLIETSFGEKYLISPASVDKHIAYIEEVRPVATSRDKSRQVATDVVLDRHQDEERQRGPTSGDQSRLVATGRDSDARYVARLEDDNQFLRGQLGVKDKTIDALLERDRESNILVGQLQQLLAPLLSAPDRQSPKTGGEHKAPSMESPAENSQAVPRGE